MKSKDAIQIVNEFKGTNLKQNLNEIKASLMVKGKAGIPDLYQVYKAALEVKKLSAQIDEVVHSAGIIICLPRILAEDEKVVDLSLASGADGEGIDLVTDKRIAEFKFSNWQTDGANGMRKRQVFSDLVNLYLYPSSLKKELYVFNSAKIISFFQSKKASWKNVLSKSGGLDKKLEAHLLAQNVSGTNLNDVYSISKVEVIDIDKILNDNSTRN